MSLFKLKAAPLLIIEDCLSVNALPLILETIEREKNQLNIICYEQPVSHWKNVFKENPETTYYEEFDPALYEKYKSNKNKCSIFIDSANQMALCLGWNEFLKNLKRLLKDPNVVQIILVLHKDCLSHSSKLQIHLNYIASATVSYEEKSNKIKVQLKKNGKIFKSEEMLSYDNNSKCLKSTPITKEEKKVEEAEKPLPENLTTFKIEVDQTDKLEKYKLKLPYMSKINEGESKVYYEPDAVDDWDEEDPDEDLDI